MKETAREKVKRLEYESFLASRGRPAPQSQTRERPKVQGAQIGGLFVDELDPRIHNCACGKFGQFGLGETWFCRAHLPVGYFVGVGNV